MKASFLEIKYEGFQPKLAQKLKTVLRKTGFKFTGDDYNFQSKQRRLLFTKI